MAFVQRKKTVKDKVLHGLDIQTKKEKLYSAHVNQH